MPATIFNGDYIKNLKSRLKMKNDKEVIFDQDINPIVSGFDAPIGSILMRPSDGMFYRKFGLGNTDWITESIQTLLDLGTDSGDPHGFVDENDVSVSFDNGTRTFTIEPAVTSYEYYTSGKKTVITTSKTIVIPDVESGYFFFLDHNGALSYETVLTVSLLETKTYCAVLYWDATNSKQIYFARESHTTRWPKDVWIYTHQTRGTQYISGLALSNFSVDGSGALDAHAQFSCENGIIADEDLRINITNGAPQTLSPVAQLPVFYLDGTNWRKDTATNFAMKSFVGGSGLLAYNDVSGGVGSQVEVGNLKFVLSIIFANNDTLEPVFCVQGQSEYNTISQARIGAENEINNLIISSLIFEEYTPIGVIINQTSTAYTNTPKARIRSTDLGENYVNFRGSGISPAGSTNNHSTLANLGNDDHTQYHHVNGRNTNLDVYLGASTTDGAIRLTNNAGVLEIWQRVAGTYVLRGEI